MKFIRDISDMEKIQREVIYPLGDLANMAPIPYQKISKITEAYPDIIGIYDALFDELGSLGEWAPIMENVKYLNLPLSVVEEYFGCLPEDVSELRLHEIDATHEKGGLYTNRVRLLTYAPVYLLERVRYLRALRDSDNSLASIDYLFARCKEILQQLEICVCDVSTKSFEIVDPSTAIHHRLKPSYVGFDVYKSEGDGELVSTSILIPLELYDMLRNDDLIGYHIAFLNYEFSIRDVSTLYEDMKAILDVILRKEE